MNFYIRIASDNIPAIVDFVSKTMADPGYNLPFNYFFFSDKMDEMYTSENKLNSLFNIFSILTIFITCLGLLGMTFYVTEQRSKEIGIRKITGAEVRQVVWLLNKDFITISLVSFRAAGINPVYTMQRE